MANKWVNKWVKLFLVQLIWNEDYPPNHKYQREKSRGEAAFKVAFALYNIG